MPSRRPFLHSFYQWSSNVSNAGNFKLFPSKCPKICKNSNSPLKLNTICPFGSEDFVVPLLLSSPFFEFFIVRLLAIIHCFPCRITRFAHAYPPLFSPPHRFILHLVRSTNPRNDLWRAALSSRESRTKSNITIILLLSSAVDISRGVLNDFRCTYSVYPHAIDNWNEWLSQYIVGYIRV